MFPTSSNPYSVDTDRWCDRPVCIHQTRTTSSEPTSQHTRIAVRAVCLSLVRASISLLYPIDISVRRISVRYIHRINKPKHNTCDRQYTYATQKVNACCAVRSVGCGLRRSRSYAVVPSAERVVCHINRYVTQFLPPPSVIIVRITVLEILLDHNEQNDNTRNPRRDQSELGVDRCGGVICLRESFGDTHRRYTFYHRIQPLVTAIYPDNIKTTTVSNWVAVQTRKIGRSGNHIPACPYRAGGIAPTEFSILDQTIEFKSRE